MVGFHNGNASGTAATYTNFYGTLNGNVTGLASTASAVTIGAVASGTYYPTFVNVNTAAIGLTLVTDANISFNAATNNLTTDIISVCEYTEFPTPIVWDNCGDISLSWQEITVDSISPCN